MTTDHDLDKLLTELKATLAESESLADADRARLTGIIGQIEDAVDDEHHGVVEQIEDAVHRFETEHVTLVSTLNRIANALSAGGL